ncbi:MAG: lactate permease LctP family transporter [Lachnospiraceae bacterium]|nr:lactate permease LctP family transporter [Lachnospiraceae bacterium]
MFLKFILALLPIIWLIVAMSILKMPGFKACFIAFVITFILAISFWHLNIVFTATAALEGICNALWPIIIVILAALFVYNLTLKTGAMEKIKAMLAGVSTDKRILMLLIAFGFGNFMEGMAGFGTAVAIPAGILVGLGFDPILSIVSCLIINSTPTAFGSVGVPTNTMANITGFDVVAISGNVAKIQLVVSFLLPFIAVIVIGQGVKALKGLVPMILIADITFLVPQYIVANVIGPDLANIIGAIVCMIAIIIAAMKLPRKKIPEFEVESNGDGLKGLSLNEALVAWSPFILIFVFLLLTSTLVPFIHDPLASINSKIQFYAGENPATLTFYWINTPGVLIILAGIIGGLIQGAGIGEIFGIFGTTVKNNVKTIITICSVLAVAKMMGYSGMISDIANVLVAVAGDKFPLISPLIGTIGGFVTGSGTSTTALFGQLQVETANKIGANPVWLAAANLMGAGIGKMICPQSIAIGTAACSLSGAESKILSKTAIYTILFALIGGLVCFFLQPPVM